MCDEDILTATFETDERIINRHELSYTLDRSCTLPIGCFTLWTSLLGWPDTLCSN
jgi:hypothetical protein